MPQAIWIAIICLVTGVTSLYFLPPNNVVEEISEDVIKENTGIDINISGEPEDKHCGRIEKR
jgi:hypothetical protein